MTITRFRPDKTYGIWRALSTIPTANAIGSVRQGEKYPMETRHGVQAKRDET